MTAPRRLPVLLLALLLVLLAGCSAPAARPAPPAPRAVQVAAPATEPRALRVLRSWDDRRARAWAHGSVGALRDLYLPGSEAGRSDVRRLAAWRERGLAVRGMRTQVLALRVLRSGPRMLRVRVVDRLAAAEAVLRGTTGPGTPLPREAARTRTVTLLRAADGWRVGAVLSGPGPR